MKPSYYAIIPAEVRYSKLKPNAKLLYGEITALSSKEGYCFATNNYFAKLYNVTKNTISLWVSQLHKAGFISVELIKKGEQITERRIGITKKDDRASINNNDLNNIKIINTNNISIREKFIDEVMTYEDKKVFIVGKPFILSKDVLEDFINYWTEGKKKMRYQKQSTFEIKLRLLRWAKNQKKWDSKKQTMSKLDSQINEWQKAKDLLK